MMVLVTPSEQFVYVDDTTIQHWQSRIDKTFVRGWFLVLSSACQLHKQPSLSVMASHSPSLALEYTVENGAHSTE